MSSQYNDQSKGGKIMLVGTDDSHILERRFQAAGCRVVKVCDNGAALDRARRESFDATVLVPKGSLINVTETIFNLRDLNSSMEIIILVDRLGKSTNRFLRQLLQHPIEGTQILTRRQLQRQLHGAAAAPPGGPA